MPRKRNTLNSSLKLLNLWLQRQGLDRTWQVEVSVCMLRGAHAKIEWPRGAFRATLKLNQESMETMHPKKWEHVVIHETRHLAYARLDDEIERLVGDESVVAKALDAQLESVCDTEATLLQRVFSRRK